MESPPCSSPPTTVRRNPPRRAKQTPSAAPENLKVFLRIRPLQVSLPVPGRKTPMTDSRVIGRGGLPKGGRGKSASCLTVNGPSSVTLLAPPSLLDQKRAKNEVYDGFSFVFPPDSSQQHIYDRVVNPIVMDFMGDTSSLLVALGPTGSGKTYTMFGHGSEPGIVHLILKKLLGYPSEGDVHAKRSYYMSMFEIYAERGKGERILDLSTDGVELSFQNSSLIGLNEVMVSNVQEAQNLLSLGILKRSTAATNANNHSSRSQCIINIRSTENSVNEHNSSDDAVLTIADLAGAEREKKTGNQGSRLLESNFINNTSMVFSLCLRSLLEYQRKPKKPLEKHFKNSLLTRYLRDYMEGKKRMTLILTVKPGEDDYADTSFLLRQASPYMKITFTNLEELPRLPIKKRSTPTLVLDRHKRRKTLVPETSLDIEGTCGGDRCDGLSASDKDSSTNKLEESSSISTRIPKPAMMETSVNDVLQSELQRLTRQEEIMRKFSKALWSVLKQYKQKLIESENNVQHLTEALSRDDIQIMELTKELERLKSCCSCHKVPPVSESSSSEMEFVLNRAGTRMETPSYENPVITLAKEVDPGIDVCVVLEDQLDANRAVITNSMRPIVQENVLQISSSQAAKLIANDHDFGGKNHQVKKQLIAEEFGRILPDPNLADVHHVKSNDKYHARRVLKEKNDIVPNSSKADKPKRKLLPASAMLLKELSGLDMEVANMDTREKTSEVKQGSSQNCVSLFNLLRKQA